MENKNKFGNEQNTSGVVLATVHICNQVYGSLMYRVHSVGDPLMRSCSNKIICILGFAIYNIRLFYMEHCHCTHWNIVHIYSD